MKKLLKSFVAVIATTISVFMVNGCSNSTESVENLYEEQIDVVDEHYLSEEIECGRNIWSGHTGGGKTSDSSPCL